MPFVGEYQYIVVKDRRNEIVSISAEQRAALFDFLNTHEKLKGSDLLKLLGLFQDVWLPVGRAV